MDVTNIANTATSMNEAFIQQASGTAVLKKALDISADNAMALIEAIPKNIPAQHLPPHLGQNINTTA